MNARLDAPAPASEPDATPQFSRRTFLAAAACGAAAAATAGAAGIVAMVLPENARASDIEGAVPAETYDWTKHRWVFLVDATKCIGCGSCARACRRENDVPAGMYRTWIERYEVASDGETYIESPEGGEHGFSPLQSGRAAGKAFFVPKLCNHCAETPCTQVCPVGASYSTKDGVVLVDGERCIGCGYCVQACPFGSRFIDPRTHTAGKCTWCYHRITKGMLPACVEVCPVQARRFGDRKNPDDPINEILAKERLFVLQPELLTKPQCYYKGISMEVR